MQDSQDQILALACRSKSLKHFEFFPLRSEVGRTPGPSCPQIPAWGPSTWSCLSCNRSTLAHGVDLLRCRRPGACKQCSRCRVLSPAPASLDPIPAVYLLLILRTSTRDGTRSGYPRPTARMARPGSGKPFTPHPTPYTLHPTPYILHPTSCTVHPATYTLHPTP